MKSFLKNSYYRITAYIIIICICTFLQTRAQGDMDERNKDEILIAYADNYHPKLNEPIKITIHFTSPGDFEKGKFNLGFSKESDIEIISGDNFYQNSLYKGQYVDMTVYVKFLKKKIYNVDIRFFKNISKSLFIYAGGAFRESLELQYLKSDLEKLKQAIENYKTNQTEIPLDLLYLASHYKFSQNQTVIPHNEYESTVKTDLENKSLEQFNILKQEIDGLTKEAITLYKTFRRQKSEAAPPPEGGPSEPLWRGQDMVTTIEQTNVSEIAAIKFHKSPYNYFLKDLATGQIIPLSNIRVEPSTLGSISEYADHSFSFIANSNVGTGTLFATNTWTNTEVSLPITVFGDFTITGGSNSNYCKIELYDIDIDNGNETLVASTFANSTGFYSFSGVNVDKFKLVVKAVSNNILILNVDENQQYIIWSDIDYPSSIYCSDHISKTTNVMGYNPFFYDWGDINSLFNSLEKGFNYDPNLSLLQVKYQRNGNVGTSYDYNYNYLYVDGRDNDQDAYDEDVLLHEFGHFYMDNKAGYPDYIPLKTHYFDLPSTEYDAYIEGWGNFFSSFIRGNADYLDRRYGYDENGNLLQNVVFNLESLGFTSVIPDGNKIEGDVAAVLWDLYDGGSSESWDQLGGLYSQIFDIMKSNTVNGHTPYTIKEFSELWASKRYPDIRGLCSYHGIQVAEFTSYISGITPVLPEQSNYSAEAALQMMLNYMGVPATQSTIYSSSGAVHSSLPLNSNNVLNAIRNLTSSNYTWSLVSENNFQTVVDYMVKWVGYNFETNPTTPHSPAHLPCLAPFNSSYNDWRVINGFVVSSDPWQGGASYSGDYTIYGLWVTSPYTNAGNEAPIPAPITQDEFSTFSLNKHFNKDQIVTALNPNLPSGGTLGGGETFYSISTFQNYFTPINGYYETVLEPPLNISKPYLGESYVMNIDKSGDPIETIRKVLTDNFSNHIKTKNIVKQFDSYKNQSAIDLSLDKEYKIITLEKGNKTYLGIILDKTKQQILEMNIPDKPVKFELLSEKDAIKVLVKNNILKEKDTKSIYSRLIYLKEYCINKYYPLWELKKDSVIYYVNQDSEIININLNKNNGKELANKSVIQEMDLLQNYPNPFNPSTVITFSLDRNSFVNLTVYDILGREVKVLINENKTMGNYTVHFDARELPSGIYIYKLNAGNNSIIKKMVLTK